jgi:hypothetical protein
MLWERQAEITRRSDIGLQRGTRPRIANDRTGSTEEMEDYRGVLNVRLLLPVALPERNLAERLKLGESCETLAG